VGSSDLVAAKGVGIQGREGGLLCSGLSGKAGHKVPEAPISEHNGPSGTTCWA
jgi:hypothetical protein